MASARELDVKPVVALGQLPVDQCAEPNALCVEFLAEHGVEVVQHLHRIVVVDRCRAQRVPGQSGHHRRLDALPGNVAQKEAPRRAGHREEVIEIATRIVDRRGVV